MAEVGFHHVINLILAQLNERFKMWQELLFTARLEEDVKFSLRDIMILQLPHVLLVQTVFKSISQPTDSFRCKSFGGIACTKTVKPQLISDVMVTQKAAKF